MGWSDKRMATERELSRVVRASREIAAGDGRIFELIADPAQQPRWDGNDNRRGHLPGSVSAAWVMSSRWHSPVAASGRTMSWSSKRAAGLPWMPAEVGKRRPGHSWRWELEPIAPARTRVTCTYDWTQLMDKKRLPRALGDHGGQAPGLA